MSLDAICSVKSTAQLDKTIAYRNPDGASNLKCAEYIFASCSLSAIKETAIDILIAAIWQKNHTPVDRLAQNNFKSKTRFFSGQGHLRQATERKAQYPRFIAHVSQWAQVQATILPDWRVVITYSDDIRTGNPTETCLKSSHQDNSSSF